ncbi:hypothetical protein [Amycolatopsis sp. cmx-4-54]|uniref:hypothetical protein n=1 Tax=Amycolatopsis sp. cmx-4-54 TaxID=2790936 RepID=UPI003978493F
MRHHSDDEPRRCGLCGLIEPSSCAGRALLDDGATVHVSPKLASFGIDERRSIVPHVLDSFAA